MTVRCGAMALVYAIPMLLGRTYDMQENKVGIDIYAKSEIEKAKKTPFENPLVLSEYKMIDNSKEKKQFLGISGELALKVSAGLLDVKGSGKYLKDLSNAEKSVEILIKMNYITMFQTLSLDVDPLPFWKDLPQESVGTHVVTELTYGGEVYASVNFIAHKAEDLQEIQGEVAASISKEGAFDLKAAGKLESLSQNISSKAKMEIDYYATVPLESVPTTMEGLRTLVNNFKNQVLKVNNGSGVAICARMTPLSDFKEDFKFEESIDLSISLERFSAKFEDLRKAKSLLKNLVSSLSDAVQEEYLNQVIDFSDRLTKTLMVFHDVIGNMDLQQGSSQLEPAEQAYVSNLVGRGYQRYTFKINELIKNKVITDDPYIPRGIYVRWGKRSCGSKASNILYIGFLASSVHDGFGAGTEYQCLPENPVFSKDADVSELRDSSSRLSAARYKSLSVFNGEGKLVEDKVASCTVCETPMRPSVQVFPATVTCPDDWVQEYTGFLVSVMTSYWSRTEHICLDYDPETFPSSSSLNLRDPLIYPVKMSAEVGKNKKTTNDTVTIPCAVCSK